MSTSRTNMGSSASSSGGEGKEEAEAAACAGGKPAAAVVAGFEQEEGGRKLNPGALMSEPGADFLRLWRASWFNYSARDWDYK